MQSLINLSSLYISHSKIHISADICSRSGRQFELLIAEVVKFCLASNMKTSFQKQVIGIPIRSAAHSVQKMPRLLVEHEKQHYIPTPANKSLTCKQNKTDSMMKRMEKIGKKAQFAHGIGEHGELLKS
ncbi:unnamed protein product [Dovyalis caffra]|uniref:Uncharacterized protein n=1 Tax=Dovyalis caffra TaxID=77055 RepID=A0AAV1RMF9_9ROSI|nr:unnamed protein product [Dovyalis caffra]